MDISDISGLNFPDNYTNWALGGGNNPAALGELLREAADSGATWNNAPTPGTYTISTESSFSPSNIKNCD